MYSHLLHWQVAANYSLNNFTNDWRNYETCTEHSFLKLAIFYALWFDTSFRTNWPYLNYIFFAASNHSVTGLKTIYEQNFQKVSVDTWFSIFLFLLLCYSCATYTPKKKRNIITLQSNIPNLCPHIFKHKSFFHMKHSEKILCSGWIRVCQFKNLIWNKN